VAIFQRERPLRNASGYDEQMIPEHYTRVALTVPATLIMAFAPADAQTGSRAAPMISIDGMRPDYVSGTELKLNIPTSDRR